MILEQKLHEEDGKTILTNRIDCTEAIETAKSVSDEPSEKVLLHAPCLCRAPRSYAASLAGRCNE